VYRCNPGWQPHRFSTGSFPGEIDNIHRNPQELINILWITAVENTNIRAWKTDSQTAESVFWVGKRVGKDKGMKKPWENREKDGNFMPEKY